MGWLGYDGNGNGSFVQSISRNGDYTYDSTGTFTYDVAPDCTGKAFMDGDEFARFVVVEGGSEAYIFSESDGNAVYGVARQISKGN